MRQRGTVHICLDADNVERCAKTSGNSKDSHCGILVIQQMLLSRATMAKCLAQGHIEESVAKLAQGFKPANFWLLAQYS